MFEACVEIALFLHLNPMAMVEVRKKGIDKKDMLPGGIPTLLTLPCPNQPLSWLLHAVQYMHEGRGLVALAQYPIGLD